MTALVAVASATTVSILPVVYHHLQYFHRDWEKFQRRSHAFISFGPASPGVAALP